MLGQFYFSLLVVVNDVRIGRLHALLLSTVSNITQIHDKHRFFTDNEFHFLGISNDVLIL